METSKTVAGISREVDAGDDGWSALQSARSVLARTATRHSGPFDTLTAPYLSLCTCTRVATSRVHGPESDRQPAAHLQRPCASGLVRLLVEDRDAARSYAEKHPGTLGHPTHPHAIHSKVTDTGKSPAGSDSGVRRWLDMVAARYRSIMAYICHMPSAAQAKQPSNTSLAKAPRQHI